MPAKKPGDSTKKLIQASADQNHETYVLRLYVTGMTPHSMRAISDVKKLCEQHLHGQYELEVIDLYQTPQLEEVDQIIATPTLIKKLPLPLRRVMGDMSQTERVLIGLDIKKS